MIRRVNGSITTRTQYVLRVADSHRNKSQLHKLSFVAEEGKPGRTSRSRLWPVIDVQDATNQILVDLDTESQRDLLSNAGTTPIRVAPFHCNDGIDEFRVRSLWARPLVAFGRKQNSVLSFAQQAVKMQQRGRLQSNSGTQDTCRADEKRAQSHDDPIGGSQIGSTFATSTEDQHLIPNQHGFGNNGTESTGSCESRQGHHQMKK